MRAATFEIPQERSQVAVADVLSSSVWFIPLLYPLVAPALTWSTTLALRGGIAGASALAASLVWAMSGPFAAVLVLNFLDRTGRDRSQYRLSVSGAYLAAITPPFFAGLAQWLALAHLGAFWLEAWYGTAAVVAVVSLTMTPSASVPLAGLRRVHGYAAALITAFALAHIANHAAAIASLTAHVAVQNVLRPIYRERILEIGLVASIVLQIVSGVAMTWRSHLRKTTALRNVQTVSGIYLAVFLGSHVLATISGRQHADTTFAWATGGPTGLMSRPSSMYMLPYYSLSVLALFVHLGCQARWNLARVLPAAAARRISEALMAAGVLAAAVIALAACGVHVLR
ncbi:MAG: hypothetical protein ABJA98_30485 [Acidobacteriota bacterium]